MEWNLRRDENYLGKCLEVNLLSKSINLDSKILKLKSWLRLFWTFDIFVDERGDDLWEDWCLNSQSFRVSSSHKFPQKIGFRIFLLGSD